MRKKIKTVNPLSVEMANAITHGFGILFGIASLPVVAAISTKVDKPSAIVAAAIYAFSFIMLFTFSTLYHATVQPEVKRVLKVLDHISIYFLIAGTYTPFLLIYMLNSFGITLLSVLWGLSLFGIVFKILSAGRLRYISTLIYIAMGWILLVGGKVFFNTLSTPVIVMVVVGGGIYTLGTLFYLNKKWVWHHVVWHLFVLSAAVCHYVAVLLAVLESNNSV
ncbi:MAG: hemolysin III family protein [Fibrobacter sp.]|nr:hemolysin III family protein [Fibrobacter sp.]